MRGEGTSRSPDHFFFAIPRFGRSLSDLILVISIHHGLTKETHEVRTGQPLGGIPARTNSPQIGIFYLRTKEVSSGGA
nr:hypothetical protein [Abies alba]